MRLFKKVFFVIAAFLLLYGFNNEDVSKVGHPMNYENHEYVVDPLGYPSSDIDLRSIYGLRKKQDGEIQNIYSII